MTMKKIFLTIMVLSLIGSASAQQNDKNNRPEKVAVGIRAGGNLASYYYNENQVLNDLPFDSLKYRVRPMLGLDVEIPLFNGYVFVAPEISFTGRGDSRLFHSSTMNDTIRYQAKVNYLEVRLPISVAIPVTPNIKPYVFAAPVFGLALDTVGPLISTITQGSDVVPVSKSNMAPYDYGVTLGAGLRYRINFNSFSLVLKAEGGYYLGLCDTYSEQEKLNQANAANAQAYNIVGERLNRGIEAAITIALPLDFHSEDDCFYWSDMEKRKNKNRGLYGF
jgi:hypothetical protein